MLFWIDEWSSVIPNTSVARRDRVEHARARISSLTGGAKIEDTFIVNDARPRCLTDTGDWPRLGGEGSGAAVLVMQG